MEAIGGIERTMVETQFGWDLFEHADGIWTKVGFMESGEDAERWVGRKSLALSAEEA